MTTKRKLLFSVIIALNVLVLAVIVSSPTRYKVDFSSVLEIWGDVFRDVDRVGLTLTALPIEREISIGDETVKRFDLRPEHPRQQYLNHVGATMAKTATRRRIPYRFHVISMQEPNAFAIAGGHVLVTTGMLDLIESEAELAAILGHEIAHIDLKHCVENLQYQMFLQRIVGSQLSQIAGIAYRLAAFGFSEIQEREADRSAIILMANAGYSPLEAVKLYQRMARKIGDGQKQRERTKGPEGEVLRGIVDALKDYFATHPAAASRMRDIEAIFDRNMSSWQGRTFYIGRSNYADRIPRDSDNRNSEQIAFSETNPEFLTARGTTAAVAGDSRKAVAILTRAIDAGQKDLEIRRTRAEAYVDLEDYGKAAADAAYITDAIAAQIESGLNRANTLMDESNKTDAVKVLQETIQNYDRLLDAYAFWLSFEVVNKDQIQESRDKVVAAKLVILLKTGHVSNDLGLSQDALSAFNYVLKIEPLNLAAIEGIALTRLGMGEKGAGLNWLESLIAKNPDEPEFFHIRSKVYRGAGDIKKADREYARYIRFRDDEVPPLSYKLWAGLEEHWDNPKYRHFKAFAVPADDQRGSWRTWSWGWSRTAAEKALHSCFDRYSRKCKLYALGERVVWSLHKQELEAAYDEYERKVLQRVMDQIKGLSKRIDDGEWGGHLLRGDIYMKLKQFDKAIADYSAYLQTVPGATHALYKRGIAYYKAGRYDRALQAFKLSIDDNYYQINPKGVIYRGYSQLFLGRPNDALKDFEWWISNVRSDPYRGLIGRAAVKLARGEAVEGMQDLERVINAKPYSAYNHNEVCWTILGFALPEAAKPFCAKANDLTIMHPDRLDSLAFMHWQMGNVEEARKLLADVKYVDPSYPDHEIRFSEYRALLTTTFLFLRGYDPGMVRKDLDDKAREAIKAYQRDNQLAVTGEIDDETIGHLTPLGFGSFGIRELPGILSRDRVSADCASASLGKIVLISLSSGEKFRCNTDGVSVRHASPEDISKALEQPAMKTFAELQDCEQCPKMVAIPVGVFSMGSPPTEHGRDLSEGPPHSVTIRRQFAVGKYEVTKGEFSAFARETSHHRGQVCHAEFQQADSEPVTCVNWKDAKAYVEWLSKKTGKTYRLLSEAEWEYVARAGTTTPFATGRTITTDQANFDGRYTYNNSGGGRFRGFTTAAGKFPPNAFGIHDMNGNVREWVEDCWTKTYDPTHSDGSPYSGDDCQFRVMRGGSWKAPPKKLRSAAREGLYVQSRLLNNGFRVARELDP